MKAAHPMRLGPALSVVIFAMRSRSWYLKGGLSAEKKLKYGLKASLEKSSFCLQVSWWLLVRLVWLGSWVCSSGCTAAQIWSLIFSRYCRNESVEGQSAVLAPKTKLGWCCIASWLLKLSNKISSTDLCSLIYGPGELAERKSLRIFLRGSRTSHLALSIRNACLMCTWFLEPLGFQQLWKMWGENPCQIQSHSRFKSPGQPAHFFYCYSACYQRLERLPRASLNHISKPCYLVASQPELACILGATSRISVMMAH